MGHLSPNHQWDMHGLGEQVLIPWYNTGTGYLTNRPERPGHGSRSSIGLQAGTLGTQGHAYAITPQIE